MTYQSLTHPGVQKELDSLSSDVGELQHQVKVLKQIVEQLAQRLDDCVGAKE